MHRSPRPAILIVVALVATTLTLFLSGCGSTSPSGAATQAPPSASPNGGGFTPKNQDEVKAYLDELSPIADDVRAAVAELPTATQGLSAQPGETWTAAADKLSAIADRLGQDAEALAALQPPKQFEGLQAAAVKVLQTAQAKLAKAADSLKAPGSSAQAVQAQVQGQIAGLSAKLAMGIEHLVQTVQSLAGS